MDHKEKYFLTKQAYSRKEIEASMPPVDLREAPLGTGWDGRHRGGYVIGRDITGGRIDDTGGPILPPEAGDPLNLSLERRMSDLEKAPPSDAPGQPGTLTDAEVVARDSIGGGGEGDKGEGDKGEGDKGGVPSWAQIALGGTAAIGAGVGTVYFLNKFNAKKKTKKKKK